MFATREQFLQRAKRRFKKVTLPVSQLTVRIQNLMEFEKEAYETETLSRQGEIRHDKLISARRRLIVLCLVDEDGNPILSEADLEALKDLDGADMAFLQDECTVHCGFKRGDIEGLVKNSESVRVADSPTA